MGGKPLEGMKNVQVKKREGRGWKEEIIGCLLMNTTAVCMTTVCWGRGQFSIGVEGERERLKENGVDINLSVTLDHTEGWNAWRIPPMGRLRQNTHCAGGSRMV